MISFSSDAVYHSLSLVLFGEQLDPEAVSKTLGFAASSTFRKGDHFSKGKNVRKNGMWCLELKSEASSPCDDLEKFVGAVPNNLFPLSNIEGVTSSRLSLWIDTSDPNSTFELSIDPQDIELMNKLGVQFCLTTFPESVED